MGSQHIHGLAQAERAEYCPAHLVGGPQAPPLSTLLPVIPYLEAQIPAALALAGGGS